MSTGAYLVDRAGTGLTALTSTAPPDEDRLQSLVENHPRLIARSEGGLLLVAREQGLADGPEAGARWSVDHLFVTREAVPVLVEVKRAPDTRLRREVIGQLLDYAANGAVWWSEGLLAQSFAATCERRREDADAVLASFLDDTASPEFFWRRVEANLRDGRMRLLIVADAIPSKLARIVEFLNEQMTAEVLAIELTYYEAEWGPLVLVPRVVGETEQTKARKGDRDVPDPISVDEWLDREIGRRGTPARDGAAAWLEIWGKHVDRFALSKQQESLAAEMDALRGGSGRPAQMWRGGTCSFDFHRAREPKRNVLGSEEARASFLERYERAFPEADKGKLHGRPRFPVELLASPDRRATFAELVRDWVAAWREGVR